MAIGVRQPAPHLAWNGTAYSAWLTPGEQLFCRLLPRPAGHRTEEGLCPITRDP